MNTAKEIVEAGALAIKDGLGDSRPVGPLCRQASRAAAIALLKAASEPTEGMRGAMEHAYLTGKYQQDIVSATLLELVRELEEMTL